MDLTFLTGIGATVASIIVFCGSVWLLLAMVMGGRLAYFVTASVTLAFTLMMGLVWSFTQLGPVGQLPEWVPRDIAEDASDLGEVPSASAYPEGPWQPVDQEDEAQVTQAAELESGATDALAEALNEDEGLGGFESPEDAAANQDATRLLEADGVTYGAVTLEAVEGGETPSDASAVVVMEYDPGNPLGLARLITFGVFVLFVLHLVGLALSERRTRRVAPNAVPRSAE